MKRIAILQSNYIPWKGYFDIIRGVDEFILYDDVQYTHSDWRNRNRIMTKNGPIWLTIPVNRVDMNQKIKDSFVSNHFWIKKHKNSISNSYSKAKYWDEVADFLFDIYEKCEDENRLSIINHSFITGICDYLGIDTKISWSMDYEYSGNKTERLVSLVQAAGGESYLSGPAAKSYIDRECFERAGIELKWMDYSGYPEYHQLGPEFCHEVSIMDMLFNLGKDTLQYMKNWETDN